METTELIRYRRALKRKNYSTHTLKSYRNILDHFVRWAPVPLSEVTCKEVGLYVDHLLRKRRTPKTITCHLQTIRLLCSALHKRRYAEFIVMRSPPVASPANTLLRCLFTPHKRACLE
jgi:site-specific recombinase XerD